MPRCQEADLARRVAATAPTQVLELAAGTGIMICDALPAGAELTATDLNLPMHELAQQRPARA